MLRGARGWGIPCSVLCGVIVAAAGQLRLLDQRPQAITALWGDPRRQSPPCRVIHAGDCNCWRLPAIVTAGLEAATDCHG